MDRILTVSFDLDGNKVYYWLVPKDLPLKGKLKEDPDFDGAAEGVFLATGGRVKDPENYRAVRVPGPNLGVSYSEDGRKIQVSGPNIRVTLSDRERKRLDAFLKPFEHIDYILEYSKVPYPKLNICYGGPMKTDIDPFSPNWPEDGTSIPPSYRVKSALFHLFLVTSRKDTLPEGIEPVDVDSIKDFLRAGFTWDEKYRLSEENGFLRYFWRSWTSPEESEPYHIIQIPATFITCGSGTPDDLFLQRYPDLKRQLIAK